MSPLPPVSRVSCLYVGCLLQIENATNLHIQPPSSARVPKPPLSETSSVGTSYRIEIRSSNTVRPVGHAVSHQIHSRVEPLNATTGP